MDPAQAAQQLANVMDALVIELHAIGEQKSCIGAGAALVSTLHRLGFTMAYPLTVRVDILNPIATQDAERPGWKPDGALQPDGAFTITVGDFESDLGPEVWPGHLVVIAPNVTGDKHVLLDPTIIQANHAESGIKLVPIMVNVKDDFTSGAKQRSFPVTLQRSEVAISGRGGNVPVVA